MRLATQLVVHDPAPDDPFRPSTTPIYQTATFAQESTAAFGRYDYSRSGNPTRSVLETQLARLEGARHAFTFASGLAALTAVTRLLRPGDEVVADVDLYGGTVRLLSRLVAPHGVTVRYADLSDLEQARSSLSPRTRLVLAESLSNPLLRVADIPGLARVAHQAGAVLAVDASAVSPYLQQPLALGADVVVHSATKYLGGHGDLTAGVVATSDPELAEHLALVQNGEGAVLAPFEAFLLLRGLATLGIRLDRQQASAARVAAFLAARGLRVHYPGLGAVVSVETGDVESSRALVEGLQLFPICVSFGSVRSTASLPGFMSHASVPPELRAARPLPADLVRLSIGLEDVEDLVADLSAALDAALVEPREAVALR
jgi:cystathionine beta-lyase